MSKLDKKNLLLSDIEIETETLGYSTGIPGQALGYKIGSLKIWGLRKKAEKALGEKFDIRRFHDAILGSGTMPLFLLEKHVEHYIEKEKNPSARGAYMLRKSLVLVFIRLRVMARHHEELL